MKQILFFQALLLVLGCPIHGGVIPTASIHVTASTEYEDGSRAAERTIDGSGLSGDLHSSVKEAMWMTASSWANGPGGGLFPHPGTVAGQAWIAFEFDRIYELDALWIWNGNMAGETDRGLREITIEYSLDGGIEAGDWNTLVRNLELAPGTGLDGSPHGNEINCNGIKARFVVITAHSNYGDSHPFYNLSEVRFFGVGVSAGHPEPADHQYQTPVDVSFSWQPAEDAAAHKVYLGTYWPDIQSADPRSLLAYTAEPTVKSPVLEPGCTYYWRVDAYDDGGNLIEPGPVWQFSTAGPPGVLPDTLEADASSSYSNRPANRSVDGSGMTGDLHGNDPETMWMSAPGDTGENNPSGAAGAAWIRYDLTAVRRIRSMWIWNGNVPDYTHRAFRYVSIRYSSDGSDWHILRDGDREYFQLAPADGLATSAHQTEIPFGKVDARYVLITAHTEAGNWGSTAPFYCLSEVRIYVDPLSPALEPLPADGAEDTFLDPVLSWQDVTQANGYHVFLGRDARSVEAAAARFPVGDLDENAIIDLMDLAVFASAWLDTSGQSRADLNQNSIVDGEDLAILAGGWKTTSVYKGLYRGPSYSAPDLEPNTIYYWRVDPVNDELGLEPLTGMTWRFTTHSSRPRFRSFCGTNHGTGTESLFTDSLGWARRPIRWDELEPYPPGHPSYIWRQDILEEFGKRVFTYKQNRVEPLVVVTKAPVWAQGDGIPVGGEFVDEWVRYVQTVTAFLRQPRYDVRYFQIWNEASEDPGFWGAGMDIYMTNVHLPASEEIRRQGGRVVYGGWPSNKSPDDFVALLDAFNAWGSIDVLDVHYKALPSWIILSREAALRGHTNLGLWQSEVGYTADLTFIPNVYPRFLYWSLDHDWDYPEKYKLMYYTLAGSDNPLSDTYGKCLYMGDTPWRHGTALQVLAGLFEGRDIQPFTHFSNDWNLEAQTGLSASSVEGFETERRVVLSVHLGDDEVVQSGGDTVTFTLTGIHSFFNVRKIDMAGWTTHVAVNTYDGHALQFTVDIADAPLSPVSQWGLSSGMHHFYIVVEKTEI